MCKNNDNIMFSMKYQVEFPTKSALLVPKALVHFKFDVKTLMFLFLIKVYIFSKFYPNLIKFDVTLYDM